MALLRLSTKAATAGHEAMQAATAAGSPMDYTITAANSTPGAGAVQAVAVGAGSTVTTSNGHTRESAPSRAEAVQAVTVATGSAVTTSNGTALNKSPGADGVQMPTTEAGSAASPKFPHTTEIPPSGAGAVQADTAAAESVVTTAAGSHDGDGPTSPIAAAATPKPEQSPAQQSPMAPDERKALGEALATIAAFVSGRGGRT
jgi:hypothetical protein